MQKKIVDTEKKLKEAEYTARVAVERTRKLMRLKEETADETLTSLRPPPAPVAWAPPPPPMAPPPLQRRPPVTQPTSARGGEGQVVGVRPSDPIDEFPD